MHSVLLAFVFALALLVDLTNGYYEKEKTFSVKIPMPTFWGRRK